MEWLTFVADLSELPLGQEVELIAKDLTVGPRRYDSHRVLAVLSEAADAESDTLWVSFRTGRRRAKPFGMKILRELKLVPTRFE